MGESWQGSDGDLLLGTANSSLTLIQCPSVLCYLPQLLCSATQTLTKPPNELICLGKDIQTRNTTQSHASMFQGTANHTPKSTPRVSLPSVSVPRRKCLQCWDGKGQLCIYSPGGQWWACPPLRAHPPLQHSLARQNRPLEPPGPAHDSVGSAQPPALPRPNNFRICH